MNIDIQDYDDIHKIIVIGDSNTGKTSLINTFCKQKAPLVMKPTIGVQFTSQIITIHDYKKIKTQIWDTAGQEKYKAITLNHYRNAVGAMIVFDLTNVHSFNSVYEWLAAVRQRAQETVQIILVGNKTDLEEKRVVTKEQAQKLAQTQRMTYVQTSIRDHKSISQAFSEVVKKISLTRKVQLKEIRIKLEEEQKKKRQSTCPC